MMKNRTAPGAEMDSAADKALAGVGQALADTRQFAGEAAAHVGDTLRDLRASAGDLARQGAGTLTDATAAAQRQLDQYAKRTTRYVAREPVKSALIAAAIGAAAAALVLVVFRHRRTED